MTLELSNTAKLLAEQTNKIPQIILEIDGIPFIYGSTNIGRFWKIGDPVKIGDTGLKIGGVITDPNSRPYISLKGTTNQITSQLEIDKGGVGGVQKFNVTLVDKDQSVTQALSPGVNVNDVLGQEANVYIGFQGGSHPEDSVRIFNGVVTSTEASPGSWRIGIDHPNFLTRTNLLIRSDVELDGSIDASQTTLNITDANLLVSPLDSLRSFVRINDEIIEYTGISTNTLTGLTRGSLGTVANAHSDEDGVSSYYGLSGNAIELSLKLMLSKEGNADQFTGISAKSIVNVGNTETVNNGILFTDKQLKEDLGLELGDKISVSGDANPANNFTNRSIVGFISQSNGIVIVVDGADLVLSLDSAASVSFNSQYNTLPFGAGMRMSQVDVAQHQQLLILFPSLPSYFFKIKDTISPLKDFLSEQVYRPSGFYQVSRKGRASVNATLPPLTLGELIELDDTNTTSVASNSIKRSLTGRDFYNVVTYKFNEDVLEDNFLASETVFSQKSVDRFGEQVPNKILTIESKGFEDTPENRNFIATQTRRFSDRYQFAAESINIRTLYSQFDLEIGDIALYGSNQLQIPDINNVSRDFSPRLMEIVQKNLNVRGDVRYTLLDTGFGQDGRYRTFSPNSFIGSGATTTTIPIKRSFATTEFELERDKWTNNIGEPIRIRSEDYSFDEIVTLLPFDEGNDSVLNVTPALSSAPLEDYLVDIPDYDLASEKQRNIYAFFDPAIEVASGISTASFTVSPSDIGKFFVGSLIIVSSSDYSVTSTPDAIDDDAQVVTIDTGTNTITVDRSLGFTPLSGYIVELVGFSDDQGTPYRFV